ncbi:MAG: hypothetical protein COV08_02270 [Candidatus Vogelbacteria bacterium CG10_big_fil_rev_8_21_14_0_10_49_38]|uniref:Cytochrome C biogenesis protein transmembrane domain-containing protein n=1 Tax=Candidatus Vogelbacteria bacterium CG10_big_fil_rev_8_21_14_0_10_49_38 TaxID=1975043 RepID=A0A2H0RIW2_9BACT|nr:MAG: hypothetical protein BK006_02290 [bacterium CG10_49_38]PIR45964.1 MAG: hypothetical protein COV08_02270 [Candidatus Vogelbacteria bacterium CG10_big_fil_rev_8_21_14_0_10_49_38]
MKKFFITLTLAGTALLVVIALKSSSSLAGWLWTFSQGGSWILPLVIASAMLDSVHPCSFSILLITIAFLFGLQLTKKKILQIGGLYIAGIFTAYFTIGIGLLKVLHLFAVPHFMGKLGATLLIIFGLLNLIGAIWPKFPLKLKIPAVAHGAIGQLINQVSLPAAFGLGVLVGLCQFPCLGGPYLMIIGLLYDQTTYLTGFGYLWLYNLIMITPLVVTLWLAANPALINQVKTWKQTKTRNVHFWAGLAMLIIGFLIFLI